MVMDEASRKLIYNVVKEDDILNANITSKEPRMATGSASPA